ncbi:MAG: ATP-binding protein, partial [Clostridia bacterium]|nr:ATP-binding protein [Clostridia bacterium]
MNVYTFINEIVFGAVEAVIYFYLFTILVGKNNFIRENKLRSVAAVAIFTLYTYLLTTYVPFGIHTIFFAAFSVALFCFITKSNVFASLVSYGIIYIFDAITQLIVLLILMFSFKIDLSAINGNPAMKLLALVITRVFQIILLFVAFKVKKTRIHIFKFSFFTKENTIVSFLILQTSMICVLFVAINTQNDGLAFQALVLILFFAVVSLGIFDLKERLRISEIEKKFTAQKEYVINMETIVKMVRREKHDYNNHLATLIAMCMQRKPDTLDRVIAYSKQLIDLPSVSSYKFFNSGNTYVDGLLAVKNGTAVDHGIHLDVDFEESLDKAAIDAIDLTNIIGNIVDNAIETHIYFPTGSDNKVVSISTFMDEENDSFNISIANNGSPIPEKDLKQIFVESYSTKDKITNKERGFGLYIVKQLLKKYQGTIHVKSDEHETEFLIKLPVKKEEVKKTDLQAVPMSYSE